MKPLPHYRPYSFAFHEKVVEAKREDTDVHATAVQFMRLMKARFEEYDFGFRRNALGSLDSIRFHEDRIQHEAISENLNNLYSFGALSFSQLYQILTTAPNGTEITSCPLCELDLIDSLDHIVPRSAMPEFSTHPLNLIPVCTKCNKRKGTNWRVANRYKYINPYLDDFFDKEFLRVRVEWMGDNPDISYEVFQGHNVSDREFEKILNHFNDLKLCQRYASRTSTELASIANSIQSRAEKDSELEIRASLKRDADSLLAYNGKSYWLALLKLKCASDSSLFSFLLDYKPLPPFRLTS